MYIWPKPVFFLTFGCFLTIYITRAAIAQIPERGVTRLAVRGPGIHGPLFSVS